MSEQTKQTKIDPRAVVSPLAKLGEGVEVGPFAIIEDNVEVGEGTKLLSGAILRNGARIGKDCIIHPYAVVGGEPQDLKFKGEESVAIVGDRTTIREFATISRGTASKGFTKIGSDVLMMAYTHVAHDCEVSDKVIIGNACQVAGEVVIDEQAILGGGTLVHQFVHIGCHTMIQGGTRITKDIPPYTLIGREPAMYCGINIVGLRRRQYTKEQIYLINDIYRTLYNRGLNNSEAIQVITEEYDDLPEKQIILDFIQKSTRGIVRGSSLD
ncbi:acyl-ACP--UDP-N-acetylglucosamine O-acyltransferase [uncultured Porphyromonas sp.]|uniref:acyl-ACP--UDP-N-acetylglucosamine O-acyltransferase n=1 Tax=uncultured Porphyromonas sp. TaxID=159274 RepID=UPI0005DBBA84|nr:acyl-ACP--UDP-N-acetylglucosamine O-acyltransferase [uncultured Porphyromonas sp.]CQB86966.1 putative udp-n-acetylglucosamine acyltransferase [Chlamydia trachomatis]